MRHVFESLKHTIDFFITDFGREAKSYEVNIVGAGEPLLNFDLVKKLKTYCQQLQKHIGKPIIFWVFTNGTVFNDDIVDFFMAERQGLTISLDGPSEIHDKLRPFHNGQGSHVVIAEWIQKILEKSKGKGGLENFWGRHVIRVLGRHKIIYRCGAAKSKLCILANGDIGSPDQVKCELVKKLVELAIVFVNELQTKSPENYEKVRRYIDVQQKIISRTYGLL